MSSQRANTNRLLTQWKLLRSRYGLNPDTPEVDRLSASSNRRLARVRHLKLQLAEIETELEMLTTELRGIDKTIDLVVSEAIADLLDLHAEAWSPTPVLGYRIWDVGLSGFHGFRQPWTEPSMRAYCSGRQTYDEVPHTDGRCGEPPCGIYAAKNVETLLLSAEAHPTSRLAVGLVAMTGKVVEHEKGYRASNTQVIALGVSQHEAPFVTADSWQIESLFRERSVLNLLLDLDPLNGTPGETSQNGQIVKFLKEQETEANQWTLENRNES